MTRDRSSRLRYEVPFTTADGTPMDDAAIDALSEDERQARVVAWIEAHADDIVADGARMGMHIEVARDEATGRPIAFRCAGPMMEERKRRPS